MGVWGRFDPGGHSMIVCHCDQCDELEFDLCEDCGERIEDECLTSCTCATCEHGDLEADLDRAAGEAS